MEIQPVKISYSASTLYKSVVIAKGKLKWSFMRAIGSMNYVSILKMHANPFGGMGKRFDNFDQAQENYRDPELKTMILMAEIALR